MGMKQHNCEEVRKREVSVEIHSIPDDPFASTWMPIELAMTISKPGGYKSRPRFLEMCERGRIQVRGALVRTSHLAKYLDERSHTR